MGTGTPLPLDPIEAARTRSTIRHQFPNLAESFQVTSDRSLSYNCIAWAAEDTARWWWPTGSSYWPCVVSRAETLDSFVSAFATLGYAPCADGDIEPGVQKVAIFLSQGMPTHMARQLSSGSWTSKLGKSWDIEHAAASEVNGELNGELYGGVFQYLSKSQVAPA